jgi:hypothetical protein
LGHLGHPTDKNDSCELYLLIAMAGLREKVGAHTKLACLQSVELRVGLSELPMAELLAAAVLTDFGCSNLSEVL